MTGRTDGSNQPRSGFLRIACSDPCEVQAGGDARAGTMWNLSVLGAYIVLEPPIPDVGEVVVVKFSLAGAAAPVSVRARVAWSNPPWVPGMGRNAGRLPPGIGVEFTVIGDAERDRIAAMVRSAYPRAVAGRVPERP